MHASSWQHNYSNFNWLFEYGRVGKEKKSEYLKNEENFLDETKSIFIIFELVSFGKTLKNSRHKP